MLQLGNAQKTHIDASLRAVGLPIQDFTWQWRPGMAWGFTDSEVPTLAYLDTRFVFALAEDAWEAFRVYYIPAGDRHSASHQCRKWSDVLDAVQRWAIALRQEISAGDPWAALVVAAPKQIARAEEPDTTFSPVERERIGVALDRMRDELFRLGVANEGQQKVLTAAFDEQRQKTGHFPRVDWSNQFVGWVLGLFTTLALSPEARQVVGAAATAVLNAAQVVIPLLSR
jgi:hypothetical protein